MWLLKCKCSKWIISPAVNFEISVRGQCVGTSRFFFFKVRYARGKLGVRFEDLVFSDDRAIRATHCPVFTCAQLGACLSCKSDTVFDSANRQLKKRVSTVRWNLKEVSGKTLAWGIRTTYKSYVRLKDTKKCIKSRQLHKGDYLQEIRVELRGNVGGRSPRGK